jgi:polyisoprenoid-binding protein YceI
VRVFDERSASVVVLTFKDGLLSAMAHDLKLRFERFRIEIEDDGSSVKATFDTASLRVVNAVGTSMPRAFHDEIEKNIERDVLQTRKFPEATFVSTSINEREIVGTLTLHGVAREVRMSRDGMKGRVRIDQRDFGIKPFSAMMGTLKIKPEVEIIAALV